MKILITGGKGQLGTELAAILADGYSEIGSISAIYQRAEVVSIDIDSFDLADMAAVNAFAAAHAGKPFDLVFNCAAMTNVDACESDQEAAMRGNAVAPRNIARFAAWQGAKLMHVSTDYVFDGRADKPYAEWDLPAPATAYGKSKLLGEDYVRAVCSRSFIVRTAWLYGRTGNNFVKTIRRIASENERITVVNDQVGNPTNAADLAHHMLKIAVSEEYGLYHVTGNGICSWFEFAQEIVRLAGLTCEVAPVTTAEYPRPAPRPAYSAMDHLALRVTVGDEMRLWQEALAAYITPATL